MERSTPSKQRTLIVHIWDAVRGRRKGSILDPAAIAETYWRLHDQDASAWSQEVDLRPSVEKF